MESFPDGTSINVPEGGLVLWVELPTGVDTGAVFEKASARRLSFARWDEEDQLWSWLPLGRSLIEGVAATFRRLTNDVRLRTGDAIHHDYSEGSD